jgi:hypothetical protein
MITVEVKRIYPVVESQLYRFNDITKAMEFARASYNKANVCDVVVY